MVTEYGSCPAFGYQCEYVAKVEAQAAEIEKLRMHLDVALETLAEEGVCGDECNSCKEARAALGETK